MTLEYATLDAVKARVKWSANATEADLTELTAIVGQVNGYIEFYVGAAVGPSTATSMTLDGRDARSGGSVLRVPGGIRSLTALTIDNASIDVGTCYLRPSAANRLPGWPAQQIWLGDGRVYYGFDNVVATGSFGFQAIPAELSEIAEVTAARAWYARQSGQRDMTGSDQQGNPLVSRYISYRDRDTLNEFRDRIGIKKRFASVEVTD